MLRNRPIDERTQAQGAGRRTGAGALGVALLAAMALALALTPAPAQAARLDATEQMDLEAFSKLREVERYQMKIAEKYYLEENYKVALAEYEKYLTLYEKSSGAPYAQLMWSHCQRKLRKVNTAIKEGFQSVIDYWPDSPEAVIAGYMIARCYKDSGEINKARKAYAKVMTDHPDHVVAVRAKVDLLDIARIEEDPDRQLELLKDLTFKTNRQGEAKQHCANASRTLAARYYNEAAHDKALEALATTYKGDGLVGAAYQLSASAIWQLTAKTETAAKGSKLADTIIQFIAAAEPTDLTVADNKALARKYAFWTADVHGYAHRPAEVFKVYEQMVKTFGVDDEILGRLAQWFIGQNRRDEARSTYARFDNQVNGQSAIAGMWRQEKKYDKAVDVYQGLIQLDPTDANKWQWEIGHCYREASKYREAINVYRQVDGFPSTYNQMAWCHRQLKEPKEAIVLYRQVMADEGSAPEALLQIGYTFEQAGQKESAIKSFQQVCKRFPKTGQASRAHAHLQTVYKISVTLGGATEE